MGISPQPNTHQNNPQMTPKGSRKRQIAELSPRGTRFNLRVDLQFSKESLNNQLAHQLGRPKAKVKPFHWLNGRERVSETQNQRTLISCAILRTEGAYRALLRTCIPCTTISYGN